MPHGRHDPASCWARVISGAFVGTLAAALLSALVVPLSLVLFGGVALRPALLLCIVMLVTGMAIGAWQRLRRA